MQPPFDSLANPDAFEALTFDLLSAEGFVDLVWRGPGADGGRDLEAVWQTSDPTGYALRTRWYIECKLYTGSVPFSEIEPKLLAALCARSDYLLVVTSSRVMNTAMDSIQRWLDTRAHPFRVRYWNGHDVVQRVARHPALYQKHFTSGRSLPWAVRDAEVSRLQTLIASSSERLVWSVVPVLQWASQYLSLKAIPEVTPVIEELDLLLGSIRLHQLLASGATVSSSTRTVSVSEILGQAVEDIMRRGKKVTMLDIPECEITSSKQILRALLFELLINSVHYAETSVPTVTLLISDSRWSIVVKNSSKQRMLATWPVLGYRGEGAKRRNPGGQGLGASLAKAGADNLKMGLTWTVDGSEWVAELAGGCA